MSKNLLKYTKPKQILFILIVKICIMKTLIFLLFLTISTIANSQKSIVITLSNPGESVPGIQFSHVIKSFGYQVGGEYKKDLTRLHTALCAPITDELSWLTLGLGYTKQPTKERLSYEFGFLIYANKLTIAVGIDGQFQYGRMGVGFNF